MKNSNFSISPEEIDLSEMEMVEEISQNEIDPKPESVKVDPAEVIPPEIDPDSIPVRPVPVVDIFSEFDGLLPEGIQYNISRIGLTGKPEFVTFANAPYSVQQIAENFGGGEYLVMARDPASGKYVKRKVVTIAKDVYVQDDSESEDLSEERFLKRMERYSKLGNNKPGFENEFMEVMAKQMQMIMQMSNNMMIQNMEMMKQANEAINESGGGDLTAVASLVEKFISGRNEKKPKTGGGKK